MYTEMSDVGLYALVDQHWNQMHNATRLTSFGDVLNKLFIFRMKRQLKYLIIQLRLLRLQKEIHSEYTQSIHGIGANTACVFILGDVNIMNCRQK